MFIRYKNSNKKKFPKEKWLLKGKSYPFLWVNKDIKPLEEVWIFDMGFN